MIPMICCVGLVFFFASVEVCGFVRLISNTISLRKDNICLKTRLSQQLETLYAESADTNGRDANAPVAVRFGTRSMTFTKSRTSASKNVQSAKKQKIFRINGLATSVRAAVQ